MLTGRKKLFRIFALIMCVFLSPAAPTALQQPIQCQAAISLYENKISIGVGENYSLGLKGTEKTATWKSNNEAVASVDEYGMVFGFKKGKVVITATLDGKKYRCEVTVTASPLKYAILGMLKGTTLSLKDPAYSISADWYTSDSDIASVSSKGTIKAKKSGLAEIFVDTYNHYYVCHLYVLPAAPEKLNITASHNSILLEDREFYEYSMDNKKWQSNNIFTGLQAETEYTVYYRVGKTINSDISKAVSCKVTTTSILHTTDILEGTYDRGSIRYPDYGNHAGPDALNYYIEANGNINVIEHEDGNMIINKYNSSLQYITSKTVELPYPIWGGFYAGRDGYFYVAVGQLNLDEINDMITYCILKYDSDWNLLGKANITGGESKTTIPYDAGACSMALYDNTLILYASRERYTTKDDGLRHESNFTAYINSETMDVFNVAVSFPSNHVSHSFNQFVKVDGDNLIFVDHGDAYPRSVVQQTYYNFRDNQNINSNVNCSTLDLFVLQGEIGDNYTGTTVSGFEIGESSNLVVGDSVPHDYTIQGTSGSNYDLARNVYLCVCQKNGEESKLIWLTDFDPKGDTRAGIPRIVKITDDRFAVLYQVDVYTDTFELLESKMCCQLIDSCGNIINTKYYNTYFPSSSNPIIMGENIVWIGLDKDNYDALPKWICIPIGEFF